MQNFINDNARFCYQNNEKVLSSNNFRRMQIWIKKKIKMENLIGHELVKRASDESGSESDNHSNDETKSDDESDQ